MQVPRDGLVQKLQRLSQSQQSIESVSSFCIFYNKDAHGVVQIWDEEFYKASAERRLALLYLANHILQEGRKKGTGFQEEFYRVLPKALTYISKHGDDKTRKQATRLVTVWEERRVFGTRHVKSFKDVLVPGSGSAAAGGAAGAGGSSSKQAAAAAAAAAAAGGSTRGGSGGGGASASAAGVGPVGDALQKVKQCAAAAATSNKAFSSSWSQAAVDTAGLSEVSAASSQLSVYTTALQEELAARRAALAALAAETAKQTAEVRRVEGQLQSAGGQQQQLEQQLNSLTQQMAASLGQMMQQQNGGTPQAPAATPPATSTPEGPDLELEFSEAEEVVAAPLPQEAPPPVLSGLGINGGDLGGLLQQLQQQLPPQSQAMMMMQQQQQPPQAAALQQQQYPQQTGLPDSLQALLGNPDMLSAAILSGSSAAAAAGGMMMGGDGAGAAAGGMLGDFDMGAFAGFGGLDQSHSGFADEGDDPYDPLADDGDA